MSESNRDDSHRVWLRERLKRRLVALCGGGLAGGSDAAAYLRQLGMGGDRIAVGYDVVDNAHFGGGADAARGTAAALRAELGLPARYFLCACRFVAKKNLPRLIEAFADYHAAHGADAWDLVLVGDGELRGSLERQAAKAGLAHAVHFPGFVQYPALPVYYGLAGAFVLPSTVEQWGLVVNEAMASGLPVLVSQRCGCARDLVEEGRNGHAFDPADRAALAAGLARVAHGADPAAMGEASRAIIARWSPERFADGLATAIATARTHPAPKASAPARLLLHLLLA